MTTSARERVVAFWDAHIAAWLRGEDPLPSPLPDWFDSSVGVGPGQVTREGFPEPFQGDLLGLVHTPRMVVLGLNPGEYRPLFQSREGHLRPRDREAGSYSRWTTTCPYNRPPWTDVMGPIRYYRARLQFTRNWLQDPSADRGDLLTFECYPWHSKSITAPLRPPPEVIEEFVWQPNRRTAGAGRIRLRSAVERSCPGARATDDGQTGGWRKRLRVGGVQPGRADVCAALWPAASRRGACRLSRAAERQGDRPPPR